MTTDPDDPGGGGLRIIVLVFAMVGCCALPLLLVSGGLGAAVGWFAGDGLGWLLLSISLAGAGFLLWQRQSR